MGGWISVTMANRTKAKSKGLGAGRESKRGGKGRRPAGAPEERARGNGTIGRRRPSVTFEADARGVLTELQRALAELLDGLARPTGTPTEIARALGLDYKLSWQVHRIATSANPLAGGTNVPARVSMRRLLSAAARRRAPAPVLERVSGAFDAFERMVEAEAGDRERLAGMLAALVPEARQQRELEIKRAAFKASSRVKGVTMEAQVGAFILHPSDDPMRVDRATFSAYVGLHRLRAAAPIGFATFSATTPASQALTLDRVPTGGLHSNLLTRYCSEPIPRFDVREFGAETRYSVAGADVGMGAAVQLVMAELRTAAMKRYRQPDGRTLSGVMNTCDIPMQRQVTDVWLHRDVYPGRRPRLGMFDVVPRGLAGGIDDPSREADRLPFEESIVEIDGGMCGGGAAVGVLPHYETMLQEVCGRLGWEAAAFRGFRLDVEFPVYGGQYMIGFEVPDAPGEEPKG